MWMWSISFCKVFRIVQIASDQTSSNTRVSWAQLSSSDDNIYWCCSSLPRSSPFRPDLEPSPDIISTYVNLCVSINFNARLRVSGEGGIWMWTRETWLREHSPIGILIVVFYVCISSWLWGRHDIVFIRSGFAMIFVVAAFFRRRLLWWWW